VVMFFIAARRVRDAGAGDVLHRSPDRLVLAPLLALVMIANANRDHM